MALCQNQSANVFDLCQKCNVQLVEIKYPSCELICDDCRYKEIDDDDDILIPKKCGICGQKGGNLKIRPRNKHNVLSQKIGVCSLCLYDYY